MKIFGFSALAAVLLVITGPGYSQTRSQPAGGSTAASGGTAVPKEFLEKMDAVVQPPDPTLQPDQAAAATEKGLQAVLQMSAQSEKDYAGAANLYLVRWRAMQAAERLRRLTGRKDYDNQVLDIAHAVLGSDCPAEYKARADLAATRMTVRQSRLKGAEAADEIRKFAARYADSNAAVPALMWGIEMAMESQSMELVEELAKKLDVAGRESADAKSLLRKLGHHPDIGQPFEVELTKLDGKALSLPKDMVGKVVIVDFWATWCGPCVAEMPNLKKLYDKFGAKGLEIVAVSMDKKKLDAEKFVKANPYTWIQCCDGPDFRTAAAYGIGGLPSVWLIGKDGKVITDNAMEGLEEKVAMAMETAASAPSQ